VRGQQEIRLDFAAHTPASMVGQHLCARRVTTVLTGRMMYRDDEAPSGCCSRGLDRLQLLREPLRLPIADRRSAIKTRPLGDVRIERHDIYKGASRCQYTQAG